MYPCIVHSVAKTIMIMKLLLAPRVDPRHAILPEDLRVAYLAIQLNHHLFALHSL